MQAAADPKYSKNGLTPPHPTKIWRYKLKLEEKLQLAISKRNALKRMSKKKKIKAVFQIKWIQRFPISLRRLIYNLKQLNQNINYYTSHRNQIFNTTAGCVLNAGA
jgi:transposase-like protein